MREVKRGAMKTVRREREEMQAFKAEGRTEKLRERS